MIKDQALKFFADWIEQEIGIIYEEHNLYQLQDRLDKLARAQGLGSVPELWQMAQKGVSGGFKQMLVDISTNNETSFFRDPKFFECLKTNILPELYKNSTQPLRIWSVASSSGQEPYSLAMLISDLGYLEKAQLPYIIATDISEAILSKAEAATYSEIEINRGISAAFRQKYFTTDINGNWKIRSEIRKMIQFKALNLRGSFQMDPAFDLILCRNVLIYQKIESKKDIISRISKCLKPGGIFLLGAGESLIGLSDEFDQSLIEGVAVYRKKIKARSVA
jgi:chemotaxis protein methyltransferase CheR